MTLNLFAIIRAESLHKSSSTIILSMKYGTAQIATEGTGVAQREAWDGLTVSEVTNLRVEGPRCSKCRTVANLQVRGAQSVELSQF